MPLHCEPEDGRLKPTLRDTPVLFLDAPEPRHRASRTARESRKSRHAPSPQPPSRLSSSGPTWSSRPRSRSGVSRSSRSQWPFLRGRRARGRTRILSWVSSPRSSASSSASSASGPSAEGSAGAGGRGAGDDLLDPDPPRATLGGALTHLVGPVAASRPPAPRVRGKRPGTRPGGPAGGRRDPAAGVEPVAEAGQQVVAVGRRPWRRPGRPPTATRRASAARRPTLPASSTVTSRQPFGPASRTFRPCTLPGNAIKGAVRPKDLPLVNVPEGPVVVVVTPHVVERARGVRLVPLAAVDPRVQQPDVEQARRPAGVGRRQVLEHRAPLVTLAVEGDAHVVERHVSGRCTESSGTLSSGRRSLVIRLAASWLPRIR